MHKEHVKLSEQDQLYLKELLSKGTLPLKTVKRAMALQELHQGKTLQAVAQQLSVNYQTIANWATKYQTEQLGFLTDKPRSGRPVVITGTQQAKITALACSQAPDGHSQWSLRLLATKIVELGYCDHICFRQVGTILKKTNCPPTVNANGVSVR